MNREEFQARLDAYGADLARWPEAARDRARRLSSESWAQHLLAEAATLDARMSLLPDIAPDRVGRAIGGVTARLALHPAWDVHLRRWFAPASGLVASGALGILVGVAVTSQLQPDAALVGHLFAAAMSYSDPVLFWALGG